jgi:hypothetical protein
MLGVTWDANWQVAILARTIREIAVLAIHASALPKKIASGSTGAGTATPDRRERERK